MRLKPVFPRRTPASDPPTHHDGVEGGLRAFRHPLLLHPARGACPPRAPAGLAGPAWGRRGGREGSRKTRRRDDQTAGAHAPPLPDTPRPLPGLQSRRPGLRGCVGQSDRPSPSPGGRPGRARRLSRARPSPSSSSSAAALHVAPRRAAGRAVLAHALLRGGAGLRDGGRALRPLPPRVRRRAALPHSLHRSVRVAWARPVRALAVPPGRPRRGTSSCAFIAFCAPVVASQAAADALAVVRGLLVRQLCPAGQDHRDDRRACRGEEVPVGFRGTALHRGSTVGKRVVGLWERRDVVELSVALSPLSADQDRPPRGHDGLLQPAHHHAGQRAPPSAPLPLLPHRRPAPCTSVGERRR